MNETFRVREPHYRGTVQMGARTIKWYEMSASEQLIADDLRGTARRQVEQALGEALGGPVGFVVLHAGADAIWLLCDTWQSDVLHHLLWRAELRAPLALNLVASGGPMACVHELVVIGHERDAYVEHVLDREIPDWDGYAASTYGARDVSRRRTLLTFDEAWRAGDVDALMKLMSESPCYSPSAASGPAHQGREAVRRAFESVIREESSAGDLPPAPPLREEDVWLDHHRALTPWQFAALDPVGQPVVVRGVDVWEFEGELLKSKDAYRKTPATPDH